VLAGQEALVGQHRRQVRVDQQEPADLPRRRDQPERRPGDDRHLPEPGPHGVEQSWVAGRRRDEPLASARDHLQVEDVVAQHAEPRDAAADAADDQRAADRQVEVVGEPGRRQPPRQRGREHLAPGRPGVDHHPVVLDRMNGPQRPHVGHDAAAGLAAAEHRVPPALGREGAAVLGGPADRGGDVLLRRREQDALRCPVHEVPEVVGGGGSGPVVDADPTVQRWRWRALPGGQHR
jgi:hypothetical protein